MLLAALIENTLLQLSHSFMLKNLAFSVLKFSWWFTLLFVYRYAFGCLVIFLVFIVNLYVAAAFVAKDQCFL